MCECWLQARLPEAELLEVKRILFGQNVGKPVEKLPVKESATQHAENSNIDLKSFQFSSNPEQLRQPRVVRIGLVQHSIKAPTTAPMDQQRQNIFDRVSEIAAIASECNVNILCLQEAFHMPFGFCTREKTWCELAEPIKGGPSIVLCQDIAKKYGMVVVCPILERDESHCDVIWNTAVVIDEHGKILGFHRKVWGTCSRELLAETLTCNAYGIVESHSSSGGFQRKHILHGRKHRPSRV